MFFIPSSTPLYILFHDFLGMGIGWGYFAANIIGGVGSFYLYKARIFEQLQERTKAVYESLKEIKCIIIMKQ